MVAAEVSIAWTKHASDLMERGAACGAAMIIDSHVHISQNGKWLNTELDASVERLLWEMDEVGIDKCLIVSLPFATTNSYVMSVVERYPEKFRGLGHLDFTGDVLKQVDEISAMGLSGIKIHPRLQKVDICSKDFDSLWERLNAKSIRILVDGYYGLSADESLMGHLFPMAYEKHICQYRKVNFVLAHAGGHKVADSILLSRNHSNFYCDISYTISVFEGAPCYKDLGLLMRHSDGRVMFGSDFPEIKISKAKNSCRNVVKDFPADEVNRIFGLNAYRLYWSDQT